MRFYIVTCDKTAWILQSFSFLASYFWKRPYTILGFKNCSNLSSDYSFISMADEQKDIKLWTRYIYDTLKYDCNEFVIFGLDDYLFIDHFNQEVFDHVISLMKADKSIVRYEMGWGAARKKKLELYDTGKVNVFKYDQEAMYRISCQISVWRTEYLLKYLDNNWTPWQFEIEGSKQAMNDGKNIICTVGDYSLRWIEESALSNRHPGMVNVLGLRPDLIRDCIEKNYFTVDQIQFGMPKGPASKYYTPELAGKKYGKYYL